MKKRRVNPDTLWRRTTAAIYRPAVDGRTYGTFEIDISNLLKFIEKLKKRDIKLTLTHIVAAAVGRALSVDIPELNSYVRRGKILPRPSVDIFISVFVPRSGEMTGFPIRNIDLKSLAEIADEIRARVEAYRSKKNEKGAVKNKYLLAKTPWPLNIFLFKIIRFVTVNMGISLKFLKVDANSFGSALISNIGTHGLQFGFPALLPASNLPMVIVTGHVEKKPVVRNNRVVIRDILPVSGVFDHRIIDGAQGGRLAQAVQKYLLQPELLENPVEDIKDELKD